MSIPGDPPIRLLLAFQQTYPGTDPTWIVQAPGREMWLAGAPVAGGNLTLTAPDLDAYTTFSVRSARSKQTVLNRPLPRWARYAAGAAVALHDANLRIESVGAVVAGAEPVGPRYEYTIGMALAALIYQRHERTPTPAELLDLLERVRRDYVEG